jgi:DNA polymerase-3 subunit alpha
MEYIPNFIARKHGREPIRYDLPEMEEYLENTYGITVYQEQVMLLSQKLANFSKGDADVLRKAMGKKQIDVLNKMKDKFIDGCRKNKFEERIADKIWKDWEAFAQYAFNKSHSTCYSLVAYQTAYLKANYPAEYMSAVLTHSQSNLDNVTFFIDECRRMGIEVLGPHLNESGVYFEGPPSVLSKVQARLVILERITPFVKPSPKLAARTKSFWRKGLHACLGPHFIRFPGPAGEVPSIALLAVLTL